MKGFYTVARQKHHLSSFRREKTCGTKPDADLEVGRIFKQVYKIQLCRFYYIEVFTKKN